jgi:hypothetical protein
LGKIFKMRFPSLHSLYSSFTYVLKRFPFEIAFAFLGVVAATVNIELSDLQVQISNWCIRLLMIANLGLILSLSATLISESRNFRTGRNYALRLFAVVITFLFLFLLDPLNRETDIFRFLLLALGFHLLVSFAAFAGMDHINAFWQFNKTLFLRFLTGALYSAVLFLGLAAAIGSMNLLFNFKFEWDTYAILWVWIAGLFQTVFFLSGVPENLNLLEEDQSYPNGLKIFTQYVLIPLASVYVVILLTYEIKILIEWDLPKGLVSNLILGYAVFGILSLLLIYPIRNLEENKWLKTYSKSFYFLLIPLLFLLIWAVAARVNDYGITEQRYFLIVLALWLGFITAYFLLSKRQDIRMIPISLCLVTLFTVYGPQGAFSVSKTSQLNQLKTLFGKYGAYRDSALQPLTKPLDSADRDRMVNVLNYLVDRHGTNSIKTISPIRLENIEKHYTAKFKSDSVNLRNVRYEIIKDVKDSLLRVLKVPASPYEDSRVLNFRIKDEDVVDIEGYKKLIRFNSIQANETSVKTVFTLADKIYQLNVDRANSIVLSQGNNSVTFDIKQKLDTLLSKSKNYPKNNENSSFIVPEKEMVMEKNLGDIKIQIRIEHIEEGFRRPENKGRNVLYYNGVLLVR